MTITAYTSHVNWPALHEAFRALDLARHTSTGEFIGDLMPGDALGGTYYAPTWERAGLMGAVKLLNALRILTTQAWEHVHRAHRFLKPNELPSVQRAVDARVRASVRVMLAAHDAYDLLAAAGLCQPDTNTILRGHDGERMYLTGLHWLAGVRIDRVVTVEQALAIAAGAAYQTVLSDADPHHPEGNL